MNNLIEVLEIPIEEPEKLEQLNDITKVLIGAFGRSYKKLYQIVKKGGSASYENDSNISKGDIIIYVENGYIVPITTLFINNKFKLIIDGKKSKFSKVVNKDIILNIQVYTYEDLLEGEDYKVNTL